MLTCSRICNRPSGCSISSSPTISRSTTSPIPSRSCAGAISSRRRRNPLPAIRFILMPRRFSPLCRISDTDGRWTLPTANRPLLAAVGMARAFPHQARRVRPDERSNLATRFAGAPDSPGGRVMPLNTRTQSLILAVTLGFLDAARLGAGFQGCSVRRSGEGTRSCRLLPSDFRKRPSPLLGPPH